MISIILAVIFLVFSSSVLIYAGQFEYTATDPLGPMFFPEMLSCILMILSVIVIVQKLKEGDIKTEVKTGVFSLPVLSIIYVLALFNIGFLISTIVFCLLITPYFQHANRFSIAEYCHSVGIWLKSPGIYLLVAFLIALVWGVFIHILHIPLPLFALTDGGM
ncbi:tripartite tricarboxylate transporter TctB family protein [Vibrio salinus]|uniref:tripartite tricarboxylate transporter TctB family protein n=1 Tax=Vibrio salinus TaxID=2899784 RepID=UPI001E415EDA|nr:tripartite tricarboxylate transporter TctB family protein [Vibrio salinus]MCE0495635.1 tripartite tricarboxylate transporter TctB family protein [Vibrio salinus]